MILRIDDPWWSDLSIKAFLVPFMNGWMMLGVAGAIYRRVPVPRFDRVAFAAGLASMLAALVSLGWPALHGARIPPPTLQVAALAGALLLAAGAIASAPRLLESPL